MSSIFFAIFFVKLLTGGPGRNGKLFQKLSMLRYSICLLNKPKNGKASKTWKIFQKMANRTKINKKGSVRSP